MLTDPHSPLFSTVFKSCELDERDVLREGRNPAVNRRRRHSSRLYVLEVPRIFCNKVHPYPPALDNICSWVPLPQTYPSGVPSAFGQQRRENTKIPGSSRFVLRTPTPRECTRGEKVEILLMLWSTEASQNGRSQINEQECGRGGPNAALR